jgi:hypothetical protein
MMVHDSLLVFVNAHLSAGEQVSRRIWLVMPVCWLLLPSLFGTVIQGDVVLDT